MSGLVVILTALVAGLVGAGCGLGVAFIVMRSRQKGPSPTQGATTTSSPGAAADRGDPAAQATRPFLGEGAPDLQDDEEDDAIPTTVFRADQLDLDAMIEQAERLKSER